MSILIRLLSVSVKPSFWILSRRQKRQVFSGIVNYGLSVRHVQVYAEKTIQPEMMKAIKKALAGGAHSREVQECLSQGFSPWRVELLATIEDDLLTTLFDASVSDEELFKIMGGKGS